MNKQRLNYLVDLALITMFFGVAGTGFSCIFSSLWGFKGEDMLYHGANKSYVALVT